MVKKWGAEKGFIFHTMKFFYMKKQNGNQSKKVEKMVAFVKT